MGKGQADPMRNSKIQTKNNMQLYQSAPRGGTSNTAVQSGLEMPLFQPWRQTFEVSFGGELNVRKDF